MQHSLLQVNAAFPPKYLITICNLYLSCTNKLKFKFIQLPAFSKF